MKNIYDNREAILNEPLSPNAFCNKGLRIRKKLGRQQKLFEDRLAEVILNFSTKMDLEIGLVTQIAKARILWFCSFEVKVLCSITSYQIIIRNYGRGSSLMFLNLKI